MKTKLLGLLAGLTVAGLAAPAQGDENLFGYLAGAETLPKGASELYFWMTQRRDKGTGHYIAHDVEAEVEYGITPRLSGAVALKGQSIDTNGIVIDGYLPGDQKYGLKPSGFEVSAKYNFLSPAMDDFGLAAKLSLEHSWLDPHSGRDKKTTSVGVELLAQKFFLDDQLVAVANLGMESTYAKRAAIADLPPDFDWPTTAEMELEFKGGAGVSYRFAPRWFIGAETYYQTEYETEIGQERWSWHAGPSLHYGDKRWWATLTWMPQIRGGGEKYAGQSATDLHLIEKTKQEIRLKVGFNF